ncbi:MAG: tRNA 4-thiouridine(8) synthase ThiI [Eubacteriales bacterium]|nr:tRNA 4-thiouridine(8) synthase ThiI [Eubacteriales bacterium]
MTLDQLKSPEKLEYDQILLVRIGEITLKGMNRHKFEQQVVSNMRFRLRDLGHFNITPSQSRIWVELDTDDTESGFKENSTRQLAVIERIKAVFGVVSVSPVRRFSGDIKTIENQAIAYTKQLLADGHSRTFKIETRRGDKRFPMDSMEISNHIGGLLASQFSDLLTVQVKNPDFTLYIEIRDHIYLYSSIIKAHRGLPSGTGGGGLLLLSGGIDSPVAGYMMASRGMKLEAIYFHAFPFTSDQAKQKVIDLAHLIARFSGRIQLHIVNFTDIQITLRDQCPPDMMTIVMRRMMMRISDQLAEQRGLKALITGESLGQVASQTLEALVTTDQIATRPVFRPLIGLDKDDTVTIARKIGTFETSILPYEDCCTVFVAKHPKTHPSLRIAIESEIHLDIEALVKDGLSKIETLTIDAFSTSSPEAL